MASTTLVNLSEDAELRLIGLLGEGAGESFQEQCSNLIAGGDYDGLVKLIFGSEESLQSLFEMDATESSSCFYMIASLIQKSSQTNLTDVLNSIKNVPGKDLLERKLSFISVLFNMLDKQQCETLICMMELAGQANLLDEDSSLGNLISGDSPRIVDLLDTWPHSTVQQKRAMYATVSKAVQDGRKQRFLILFLDTYATEAQVDAAGVAVAKQAAIGAILDPFGNFAQQRNLLSNPAIQALQKSDPDLFAILQVFQEGSLEEFNTLTSKLSQYGLDVDTCSSHMRILSLCGLANRSEEIAYADIESSLQVDNVEAWVIKAVNTGLLDAKMDQQTKTVMVERCVVRKFDEQQWKNLQSRLKLWKSNIGSILETLQQQQVTN